MKIDRHLDTGKNNAYNYSIQCNKDLASPHICALKKQCII
jgi:hypothetical protein